MRLTEPDRLEFQKLFPEMRLAPTVDGALTYEGEFRFVGSTRDWGTLEDSYHLRIAVDSDPRSLPQVWETAGRVARIDPTHVNPALDGSRTGTLCLGSYLRQRIEAGNPPTLVAFAKRCIVPYLYSISLREQGRPDFVFGELAHGEDGLLQDYEQILGLRGKASVIRALRLSALRRRIANRAPCPCGCGKRLGKCPVHDSINALRRVASRSFLASLTDGTSLRFLPGRTSR